MSLWVAVGILTFIALACSLVASILFAVALLYRALVRPYLRGRR